MVSLVRGQFLRVWDPVLLICHGDAPQAHPSLGRCSVKLHQPAEGDCPPGRLLSGPSPLGLADCTVRIGLSGLHPGWKAKGETICPQLRTNQFGVNLSSDTECHLIPGLGFTDLC